MTDFANPVVETLQASGLDIGRCIVVGGASLALHGIRPASDVDLLVEPALFAEVSLQASTPSGAPLVPALVGHHMNRLVTPEPLGDECLTLDLMSPTAAATKSSFDLVLSRTGFMAVDGGAIRVLGLRTILAIKEITQRPKDLEDIKLIEDHMGLAAVAL